MNQKVITKVSAIVAGISGIVILAGVVIPIAGYQSFADNKYPTLLSPLVDDLSKNKIDDTKASNWFPGGKNQAFTSSSDVKYFTLTIPKLNIKDASVAIAGEDLTKSLIQYPDTALPGKIGDTIIFGHSTLPIWYNPKNYMTIFSTLPSLKNGDPIYVSYDGISYKYVIESMTEVLPTDLAVLKQDKDNSYLTLITCTPPGDPRLPRRLVVRAHVVPFGEAYVGRGSYAN